MLSSCAPAAPGSPADQRELHFRLGENCVNAMDYRGAIREFEESLETDPHLAAAHFELGWLYDQKMSSPVAAIYHYERYLQLESDASNADLVKQRIEVCKQKLAAEVLALPATFAEQRRLQELVVQHQRLEDESRLLLADLNGWRIYCSRLMASQTDSMFAVSNFVAVPRAVQSSPVWPTQVMAVAQPPPISQIDETANPALDMAELWRTHTVTAGETAFRIARRYGVSLEALLAANPGLVPRRMSVGLVLNIPLVQTHD